MGLIYQKILQYNSSKVLSHAEWDRVENEPFCDVKAYENKTLIWIQH